MISPDAIADVKARNPIDEVIGRHCDLRRSGRDLVCRCPFHDDRTPSFHVNPDKGVFYCHGCGAGGDVVTFIMKIEGVSFRAAYERLGGSKCKTTRSTKKSKPSAYQAEKSFNEWLSERFRTLLTRRDECDELIEFWSSVAKGDFENTGDINEDARESLADLYNERELLKYRLLIFWEGDDEARLGMWRQDHAA